MVAMVRRSTLAVTAGLAVIVAASVVDPARSRQTIAQAVCPNHQGGSCLGKLESGSHTTSLFKPKITYSVPAGWWNFEDLPGNFLLVPPWGNLPGVNAGTSDYIGIYTSIAASAPGCEEGASRTVMRTPAAIAQWIKQHPGLNASTDTPVTIGGLRGLVLDIQMRKTWKKTCPFSKGMPIVQLIRGVGRSHLAHGIIPRPMKMRLYLLEYQHLTLAIEIVDLENGRRLATYSAAVRRIKFAD